MHHHFAACRCNWDLHEVEVTSDIVACRHKQIQFGWSEHVEGIHGVLDEWAQQSLGKDESVTLLIAAKCALTSWMASSVGI